MELVWTQLGDPSLYLVHSPFVAWAALECLVALWTATSTASWFWRWLAVIVAVSLMAPARASAPACLFALTAAFIFALVASGLRWAARRANQTSAGDDAIPRTPFRFTLRDLLLAVLLVGIALPGIIEAVRHFRPFAPPGWLASSAALAALTVLSYAIVSRPRRVLSLLLLVVTLPVCAAAVRWSGDWMQIWDLLRIFGDFWLDMATMAVLELEFVGVLVLAITLAGAARSPARWPLWRFASGGALALLLALAGGWAGFFYIQLLDPVPPRPAKFVSADNHYDRIHAIATRVNVINRKNTSIADLRVAAAGTTAPTEIEALYAEVLPLLNAANAVPYDPSRDATGLYSQMKISDIQALRGLCRSFTAESNAAWAKGDSATAVEYDVASLRLGGMLGRGGIMMNALVGMALEGVGYAELAKLRQELPPAEQRQVIAALQRLSAEREDPKAIVVREADYSERVDGLSVRLNAAMAGIGIATYWTAARFEEAANQRLTINSLLQADLAIRLFRHDHCRVPRDLSELFPAYLPAMPSDAYSGQPLRYQVHGDEFLLYSVGWDRRDDGGTFGKWPEYQNSTSSRRRGLDLSLDSIVVPPKPAAK